MQERDPSKSSVWGVWGEGRASWTLGVIDQDPIGTHRKGARRLAWGKPSLLR